MCSNFFVDFPPHKTHTHARLTTSSSSLGRGEMEESSRRSSRKLQGQHSLLQAATFRSRAILPNQAEGRSSRQQQLLSYFFDVRLLFCSLLCFIFICQDPTSAPHPRNLIRPHSPKIRRDQLFLTKCVLKIGPLPGQTSPLFHHLSINLPTNSNFKHNYAKFQSKRGGKKRF